MKYEILYQTLRAFDKLGMPVEDAVSIIHTYLNMKVYIAFGIVSRKYEK